MSRLAPEVPDEGAQWAEQDTTPSHVEEALRHLLQEQYARDGAHAPARVLNLVVVVDREWRGEIMNRLEGVGRYHASRTIVCAVEPLLRLSQIVLIDSVNEPDPVSALRRAKELAEGAYVVDLAWLRTTPWRERVASTFDPPRWRAELSRIDSVKIRHRPDSGAAGILFCGWLASRLGWGKGALMAANGSVRGHASARRQDVTLTLEPDPGQDAPGLAGIEIGTSSGMSISLDRGPGGLQ